MQSTMENAMHCVATQELFARTLKVNDKAGCTLQLRSDIAIHQFANFTWCSDG